LTFDIYLKETGPFYVMDPPTDGQNQPTTNISALSDYLLY